MRAVLVAVALALAPAAIAKPPAAATTKAFPFPTEVHTLPNGLRVVLIPYDSPGLVAYYTLMRVGSRNEAEPGRSGYAHFFEHMMFRGTPSHSGDDYNQTVTKLGLDTNAFTSDDMTVYHLYGPSKALPTIIDYEADRFQHLDYSEEQFKTEAGAILGEYAKSASNPEQILDEKMARDGLHQAHLPSHGHRLPRRRQGDAVGLCLLARVLPPLLHARQRHHRHRRRLRQEGDAGAPRQGLRQLEGQARRGQDPRRAGADGAAQRARRLEVADAAAAVARLAHPRRERPRRHRGAVGARRPTCSARPARSIRTWCSAASSSTRLESYVEPVARSVAVRRRWRGSRRRAIATLSSKAIRDEIARLAAGAGRPRRASTPCARTSSTAPSCSSTRPSRVAVALATTAAQTGDVEVDEQALRAHRQARAGRAVGLRQEVADRRQSHHGHADHRR